MQKETVIVTYNAPDATEYQVACRDWIDFHARTLATIILAYTPAGSEQDAALRSLREAVLAASVAIAQETDSTKLEAIQANAFTDFFTKTLPGLFGKLFTPDQTKQLATGIAAFIKTDVGALAVDAVEFVQVSLPGATDFEKRDAAVAKLKADAKAAGKDLEGMAGAFLNWSVETALQWVLTKGLTAALGTVATAAAAA